MRKSNILKAFNTCCMQVRWLIPVVGLVSGWLCYLNPVQTIQAHQRPQPFQSEQTVFEDDPEARADWFWQERLYPTNSIPTGARVKAIRERQRVEASLRESRAIAGNEWRSIGPAPAKSLPPEWGNVSGRISGIAVHPTNRQVIYIASATGGVWKTENGGASWTPLTDFEPSLTAGAIAIAKADPNVIYVGTGDVNHVSSMNMNQPRYFGAGVLKSTDAGTTWEHLAFAELEYAAISKVIIHPKNPDIVWIGVASSRDSETGDIQPTGVWLTTNGGRTWTRTLQLTEVSGIHDLAINPLDGNVVYAAASFPNSSDNGVYKSTDGGKTWQLKSTGLPPLLLIRRMRLAIAPSSPNILYASILGTAQYFGVYKSTDSGETWDLLPNSSIFCGLQCWYDHYIAVAPNDPMVIYLGEIDVIKSIDGGRSWSNLVVGVGNIHPDQHAIAFDPVDPNIVYFGCDGGMYQSRDAGRSFADINGNLALTQHVGLALHPTDPNIMFGGTQDNGTLKNTGSRVWQQVSYGDGGYTVVDYENPQTVYTTYIYTSILRSLNGGNSFVDLTIPETFSRERASFYAPIVIDPINPKALYFGTYRLWRTEDMGRHWTRTSEQDLTSTPLGTISAIAVSKLNPKLVYVGSSDGVLSRSTDGGATFNRVAGIPDRVIRRVTIDPADPRVAFVAVSGFGTGHVFKTTDGGLTFRDVSQTLPNIPANVVLIDPTDSSTVYVGTDIGVYRSRTSGESWVPFSYGLPNVVVTDLVANTQTGIIYAATYGRGMFQLVTNPQAPRPDLIPENLQVDPPARLAGESVTFTFDLHNVGNFRADAMANRIVFSTDPQIDETDTTLGLIQTRPINPGTRLPVSLTFSIPVTASPGPVFIGVMADVDGILEDANRANNQAVTSFRVVSPPDTQPPTVSSIGVPSKLKRGKSVSIVWSSSDNLGIVIHDLDYAADGATFDEVIVTGLAGTVQSYTWDIPSTLAKTKAARIRVTAQDAAGNSGQAVSGLIKIK